jgi:hypothetical protein
MDDSAMRRKKCDKAREKRDHDAGFSSKHVRLREELARRRDMQQAPASHRGAAKNAVGS